MFFAWGVLLHFDPHCLNDTTPVVHDLKAMAEMLWVAYERNPLAVTTELVQDIFTRYAPHIEWQRYGPVVSVLTARRCAR